MNEIIGIIGKAYELFWSIWPKNYIFLVLMSALSEAASVFFFKIGGNRGIQAVIGYILGFFVVAFYAQATRYGPLSKSYPLYLVSIGIFISVVSFLVLREKVQPQWFLGLILVLIGLAIINSSLPPDV